MKFLIIVMAALTSSMLVLPTISQAQDIAVELSA